MFRVSSFSYSQALLGFKEELLHGLGGAGYLELVCEDGELPVVPIEGAHGLNI